MKIIMYLIAGLLLISCDSNYSKGENYFNEGDFIKSNEYLALVEEGDKNYTDAVKIIEKVDSINFNETVYPIQNKILLGNFSVAERLIDEITAQNEAQKERLNDLRKQIEDGFEVIEIKKAEKDKFIKQLETDLLMKYDDFKEIKWFQHKNISKYIGNDIYIYFAVDKYQDAWLRFRISHIGRIFIENYEIKTNGKINQIIVESENMSDGYSSGLSWEYYDVLVSAKERFIINELITSDSSMVRFNGSIRSFQRYVKEEEKIALKEILEIYDRLNSF